MTLRARIPFIVIMSLSGGLLLLYAVVAWQLRDWGYFVASTALAGSLLTSSALLAWTPGRGRIPPWATRFEVVGAAVELRCNQCDTTVVPPVVRAPLPRLLTYAYLHTRTACRRRREVQPGPDTRRIAPRQLRRRINGG